MLNLVSTVLADGLSPGGDLLPLRDAKLSGGNAPHEVDGHVGHGLQLLFELFPDTRHGQKDRWTRLQQGDGQGTAKGRWAAEPDTG